MKAFLFWALGVVGSVLLVVGLFVFVSGDATWLGASPEADSGPPARIGGAVMGTIGLALVIASRFVAIKSKE